MLMIMPFLNQNNPVMAQEYDKYGDSYYSHIKQTIRNMNVGLVPLKGSLSVLLNSVSILNLMTMIERILKIIELEHKAHPVHKGHQD